MIGALLQPIGDFGHLYLDHAITGGIQHRLIVLHRVHDAFGIIRPAK